MESSRKYNASGTGIFAVLLVLVAGVMTAANTEVPFPDGYRSWQHVKSVVSGAGHNSSAAGGGKIFHFYANLQAVEGYRTGKFPNGSIIVRENLRAIPGEGESEGTLKEGERVAVDVMWKDEHRYPETAGWGFDTFDSKKAGLPEKERAQCYACHAKQKDRDLVFSTLRTNDQGTPYPEGYRHWTFLHSSMVPAAFDAFAKKPCEKPCMAGVFHFYANDKAMAGLRTGTYPDGAIIAEEMLEWQSTSNGNAKEGPRRIIGVMVKDHERYSSTGGWGYGNFDDGSRVDNLNGKQRETCHQCHVARKEQGYVFSEYRER